QHQQRDGQRFGRFGAGEILGQHVGGGPEGGGNDGHQGHQGHAFGPDARDDDGAGKADQSRRDAGGGGAFAQEQGGAKDDEERSGGEQRHHLPDRHASGKAVDEDVDAQRRHEGPHLVGEGVGG